MRRKGSLLIDIDNIITDWLGKYLSHIYSVTGHHPDPDTIRTWDAEDSLSPEYLFPFTKESFKKILDEYSWWITLPLLSDQIPGILASWQRDFGEHWEIHLISRPWGPESFRAKAQWVDCYLPFLGREKLILCQDKSLVRADILIDDRSKTLARYHEIWPEAHLGTIQYGYHIGDQESGRIPRSVFLAKDYMHPDLAWRELDAWVRDIVSSRDLGK